MERYQTEFDVHFGYWFNAMCESLYRRVDMVCSLAQLVGGSAAAAGVMTARPAWVAASGVVLAVCSATSLVVQPGVKAERHARCKCQWLEIKGAMVDMSDAALRMQVVSAQKGELGITTLSLPASNAAMRALGYQDGFAPLTWWQRMVGRLAM